MKRAIKLILIYLAYQILCSLPLAFIVVILSITTPSAVALSSTALGVSLLISSLLMLWHLIHFNYIKLNRKNLSPVSFTVILFSLLMGASTVFILDWLNEAIDLPNWLETSFEGLKNNIFGIISICFVAPVVEELLFRGAIEGYLLTKWKNPYWAILISGLIFGIIHLNPAQIPFAFIIGVLFGWLYYRTGSLLPGIILHILNNTTSIILMNIYPQDATMVDILGKNSVNWLTIIALLTFILSAYFINKTTPFPIQTRNILETEGKLQKEEDSKNN